MTIIDTILKKNDIKSKNVKNFRNIRVNIRGNDVTNNKCIDPVDVNDLDDESILNKIKDLKRINSEIISHAEDIKNKYFDTANS